MAKKYLEKEYTLTPENIDAFSADIREAGETAKLSQKYILQLQYFTEELLLNVQAAMGQETKVSAVLECGPFARTLTLRYSGPELNPIKNRPESDSYLSTLLEATSVTCSYSHTADGTNRILVHIPRKKPGDLVMAVGAIALAFVCAGLLKLAPSEIGESLCDDILNPIGDAFLAVISTCGVLMIFLSLISGITHMNNVRQLKRSGSVVVKHIMKKNLLSVIIVGATVPFILHIVNLASTEENTSGARIFDMLMDIVPTNIIEPFQSQNALQICFVAILIGVFMLIYKDKTKTLTACIDELNNVVLSIIRAVCTLLPGYIFIAFLNILVKDQLEELASCWMVFAFLLGYALVYIIITKLTTRAVCKIPLGQNLRESGKVGLMGFMTCSSIACLDKNRELTVNKFKANEENVSFAIVIQQIMYKPAIIGSLAIWVLCMMKVYGVQISITELIVILVTTFLMGVVAPPVPGGEIAVATALFASFNLPTTVLALFVSAYVFSDMILTGMQVTCVSDELVMMDRKLGVRI